MTLGGLGFGKNGVSLRQVGGNLLTLHVKNFLSEKDGKGSAEYADDEAICRDEI